MLGDCFTQDQINEINDGKSKGLDTSLYEDADLFAMQMHQIRLGLEEGLDVSVYAGKEYDWFQMEEIRLGLKRGLDIQLYASPDIPYENMRQLREGLEQGVNLSNYSRLDAGVLRELRLAMMSGIDIINYIREGYDADQLRQIRLAMENNINIVPYLNKSLRGAFLQEIRLGLEEGVDVSVYADVRYGWQQMRELRLGLEHRVDISRYSHRFYNWKQMREIRLGLEEGIDVSGYACFYYTEKDMKKLRLGKTQTAGKGIKKAAENGNYTIFLSNDNLQAYIYIRDCTKPIEEVELRQALSQCGIEYGLDEAVIQRIAEGGFKEGEMLLIAAGKAPVEGTDGWYEYFCDVQRSRSMVGTEEFFASFHSMSVFQFVEEGQKLVQYHAATEGISGIAVTKNIIKPKKGKERNILTGSGFIYKKDTQEYFAGLSGRIVLTDDRLEVQKVLVMENLTRFSENINYDGNIYVRGNIGHGVHLRAGGSLLVGGFVDDSTIEADGDIYICGGVGGEGATVSAGGSIVSSFLDNCSVVAKGSIYMKHAANCEMYAEGVIETFGKLASVAGGSYTAVKGFRTWNLGRDNAGGTVVRVGINERLYNKLHRQEKLIESFHRELKMLYNAHNDFQKRFTPEARNVMDMYLKLESAVYTKEKQLERLEEEYEAYKAGLEDFSSAEILVRGRVCMGTDIEVNMLHWTAEETDNICICTVDGKLTVIDKNI